MTKIFPHCTISVGLAPLADYIYINIGKIRIIQQTREARSARQLYIYIYIYIYLFIYFRPYVVHVPLTRYAQTSDRPVEVQRSI